MAIAKITWENKEGIENDATVERKNKVMDEDMNEIKQTVNNNADELNEAQENIGILQGGQNTAGADIKNLRSRISILETENTINKSDISSLKSDNTTNKENISTLQEQVSNKVDKVEGKSLSANDFTNEYREKLDDLENYNDELIKKDIEEIKEKDISQDELISKLQEENNKIKETLIHGETEEAKSLHVEDAMGIGGKLEVLGNHEQETREGYNLLNSSFFDLSEVSDYATLNQDGTITFNGTFDTDINIRSLRKQTIKANGSKNLIIKILSGTLNSSLRLVAQDTNYENLKYAQIGTSSFTNKLIENVEYSIFSISITSGTVTNNLKLGFMIVDDSDLSKEYEKYGAMPSPKYSSEIKCLEGSTEIRIKNEDETQIITKTLSIQQPMLEGDYFIKEADGWKEVHNWEKYIFTGTELYSKSDSYSDENWFCGFAVNRIISQNLIKENGKMLATRFSKIGSYSNILDDNCIRYSTQLHVRISTEFLTENTAQAYQNLLKQWNDEGFPLAVVYEVKTPTKLPCTEEQSAVLEELNNLDLFEGENNIITTEDIALLKLKYVVDTKTYIDTQVNERLSNIENQIIELSGGN